MSSSEMPGSSKKSRSRKKSGKSSPRSADSMTASSSSLNETPEKQEKLDSVESTAQTLQTEAENLNGSEHTNGPRKTKKKKTKKSKRRRDSKDTFLIGFSGAFPKALSTHSMESNSDAEHHSPAELKALSSTGLRVFPREEEHLQPSLPTTDNNNSISTESLNLPSESQPPQTTVADQDVSKTFLSSNRIGRKRTAAACSIGSSDEMEKLKKSLKRSDYRSKSISAPFDHKLQRRSLRTRSMCVLLNLDVEQEQLAADAIKPTPSNTRHRLYSSGMPKISPTDELYRKPFEYGWKRELVLRNARKGAAPRGDVFFIAPNGKKLRSRDDIIPLLKGDLTIDNFCFQREPVGAAPEFETVRVAVPNSNRRRSLAQLQREDASSSTPPLLVSGKRVSKPKAPKGASPPPVGWTPTMAVKGNARVLAASNGNSGGSGSTRKRGTLMKASASAAAAIAQRTSGAPKLPQPAASTSVAAKSSNVSAQALICLRCQAKIEGHNAYKFATSDKESTCHICVRCLKSSNESSRTKEAPEVQPVLSATNETINTNNADVNTNEAVHTTADDDADEEQDYGGSLEKAEEIELPGQLPPAQLLSKNAAGAAKRLSRIQDITVIGGRKYLTVAEDPPLPRTQVEHRKLRIEAQKKYSFKRSWHKETRKNFAELMNDASTGCQVLKAVMKTLPIGVLCKMAQVCNLWHLVSHDTGVWHSVSLKDTHITNWVLFLRYLARQNTYNLDMTGVSMSSPSLRMTGDLRVLKSLRTLRTDPCTAEFVQSVIRMVPHLCELYATITSPELSLANCHKMHDLRVLHIEMQDKQSKMTPFTPLAALTQLTELSVRGIVQMEGMDVKSLQSLENLQSLVLGSCIGMDTTEFGEQVLPKLVRLKRLRIENRQAFQTSFDIGPIMLGASLANSVERLELINVDLDGSFSSQLAACKSIRRLLLVPSYVSNAAKTTNSIMQAISDCKDSLSTFKLGVTQELLRMTAALCSSNEDQTCIPVVRPVPGLMLDDSLNDINDSTNNTPHEWAFLPVDRLESILQNMMPQATLTVAKIPQSQTTFLQF